MDPQQAGVRFEKCLADVAVSNEVWLLDSGFDLAVVSSDEGESSLLLWATESDAAAFAAAHLPAYEPKSYSLAEFAGRVVPVLSSRGLWVLPNPSPELSGLAVPPQRFLLELPSRPDEPKSNQPLKPESPCDE